MNAERLLQLYERVAEAPDAVARLRRFVLDLAVRGQLIKRDEGWRLAPIEKCLERLSDGKYIHQGWSPQCATHPSPNEEIWGVLKTTAVQDGYFLEHQNKELPTKLTPKPHLEVKPDDILITCAGPRARCGVACLVTNVRKRLLISGKMYRFRAAETMISPQYLALFLRASDAQAAINAMKTGSSESGLNLTKDRFRALQIEFGPIHDQRQIVAKVDELMALCDQLEEVRARRETTRDRLTAASLARLTAPSAAQENDHDAFRSLARFALDNLASLTARPTQIKAMRQTILDLAVRGKLVEKNDNDGETNALVEAIRVDRESTKQRIFEPDMASVDFAIPSHWAWESLDAVIVDGPQNGLSPRKSERNDAPKAITLTATTSGSFDGRYFKRVEVRAQDAEAYWLAPGDLLFQRGNTRDYVGMAAIYDGPANEFLFPDLIMRVRVSPRMSNRFVHLWCIAPYARQYLSSKATGTQQTMPKINQRVLRATPIAVPPLAEQQGIVAKVDQLMALCDRLEASLTDADDTRRRLLEALLHEALQPAESALAAAQ